MIINDQRKETDPTVVGEVLDWEPYGQVGEVASPQRG